VELPGKGWESQIPAGQKGPRFRREKFRAVADFFRLLFFFGRVHLFPNETPFGVLDLASWRFASSVATRLTRKKICFRVGF
jgi:hypothetical protein